MRTPPLLQGDRGFSRKGPSAASASYYYSLPHLTVSGEITVDGRRRTVTGEAWFDHEWSSDVMDEQARGWDWMGVNLDDGGALMAFRMRGADGSARWAAATLRSADGARADVQPCADRVDPGASLALAAHRCGIPGGLARAHRRARSSRSSR